MSGCDTNTNFMHFLIENINDNFDDPELFQLMNKNICQPKPMTFDSKHLHINRQSQHIKIMTNMDEMHTAKSLT